MNRNRIIVRGTSPNEDKINAIVRQKKSDKEMKNVFYGDSKTYGTITVDEYRQHKKLTRSSKYIFVSIYLELVL